MENTLSKEYQEVFEKVRIEFLFSHPFLSVLALSLKTVFKENTTSLFETDGVRIFLDTSRLEKYNFDEIKYQYAHTLLHIVLKHPSRMKQREESLWNLSCDIAVNLILKDLSSVGKMPNDEKIDEDFAGLTVEEIYSKLEKDEDGKGESKDDKKEEQRLDLVENEEESEKDDISIDSTIIQAINIAKQHGDLSGTFYTEVDYLTKPDISFEDVFTEFMETSLFDKVSTYNKGNRKFIHQGLYLPGFENTKEKLKVYIALDCSASISMDIYRRFLGLIQSITEEYLDFEITIIPFDSKVLKDHVLTFKSFENDDEDLYNIPKGNGGTNINSVVEYLDDFYVDKEALLIVLSDGRFSFEKIPDMNILFLISESKNLEKFERYGKIIPLI